jgi:hypothetical protein
MKKYSTLLSALFSCISTANAFTSGPSAVTKHQVRRSTRLGMDTSRMSTAELQKIARERGYDTVGMDRTGLEMIARGWADIVKTRPQQQGQYYEDDVLDVTGVEYSQDGYGLGNQQPQNRPSSSYGNNQPQIPQSTDRSSSPQGDYGSGRVDTQPRQQRQQPQREQPQQQQSQKSFPFFQPQGTSNNPTNNSQMDLNQNRNQYNGKRKIPFEDSLRAAAVGFFGGGFAVTPVTYLHNFKFPGEIITNEMSQFQFDTFTGAISAAAFAAVYRYFVKEQKDDVLVSLLLNVHS